MRTVVDEIARGYATDTLRAELVLTLSLSWEFDG
jgi:hypothetical protein